MRTTLSNAWWNRLSKAAAPGHSTTFFRLEKYDPFEGIAYGVAAAEEPDRDKEILDYAGSKPYFQAWSDSVQKDSGGKSFGNVRFQHDDKRPVGHLVQPLEFDDARKQIRIAAKINEPQARNMLAEGDLTGFSIGGAYVQKTPLGNGFTRYVANPSEISVVDRPCAPSASFSVVKSDGSCEQRLFKYSTARPVKPDRSALAYREAQRARHLKTIEPPLGVAVTSQGATAPGSFKRLNPNLRRALAADAMSALSLAKERILQCRN